MIFCDIELARRIDRTEQALLHAAADLAHQRVADRIAWEGGGGLAVYVEDGSPLNKAAGLGFAPFDEARWLALEDELTARGAEMQVEVSTLADPELAKWFTGRGYELTGVENILGRSLPPVSPATTSPELLIEESDLAGLREWIDVTNTAFSVADEQGVPSQQALLPEAVARAISDLVQSPGVTRFSASIDGQLAGTGSLFLSGEIALLCGAATLPRFRRRGVQTALLQRRMAHAAAAGGSLMVVTTQPGSKSQQNVQRQGFELLCSRLVLRRPQA